MRVRRVWMDCAISTLSYFSKSCGQKVVYRYIDALWASSARHLLHAWTRNIWYSSTLTATALGS